MPDDIGNILKDLSPLADEISSKLSNATRTTRAFAGALAEAVASSEEIPGHAKDMNKFLKEMNKNATLFKKIQEDTSKVVLREMESRWDKIHDKLSKSNATVGQFEKEWRSHVETQKAVGKKLDENFQILREQKDAAEEQRTIFQNVKTLMDQIGGAIRNPAAAASGMLASMGDIPQKMMDAKKETGGWGGALKKLAGDSKIGGFLKIFTKGGLLLGGLALVTIAMTGLFMLFKNYWNFMDKKVVPATAEFNRELGATNEGAGKLKGQVMSAGVQMEKLGYSFDRGAKMVVDLAKGMKTVKLDPEALKTGKELQLILGMTGEEAGELSLQFMKAEGSIEGLNEMFSAGKQEAEAWGLPINVVLKDMAQAPDVMARFGVANRKEFASSTAAAQSYGLSIKDVNQAFGKQMDTFDGTAKVAASLNAVFGTNINSMKLMMETDMTKRLVMVRGELEKQGKSWKDLNEFEKNVITSQLGVTNSQAALILSSEKERKKLEAKQRAKKKEIDLNEKWNKGLNSVKETLLAWGPIVDSAMRSVATLVSKIMGFDSAADPIQAVADGAKEMADNFESFVNDIDWETLDRWQNYFITTKDILSDLGSVLSGVYSAVKVGTAMVIDVMMAPFDLIKGLIESIIKQFGSLVNMFESFSKGNVWEGVKNIFSDTFDNVTSIGDNVGSMTRESLEVVGKKYGSDNVTVNREKHEEMALVAPGGPGSMGYKGVGEHTNWGKGSEEISITIQTNLDSRKIAEQQVRTSRGSR